MGGRGKLGDPRPHSQIGENARRMLGGSNARAMVMRDGLDEDDERMMTSTSDGECEAFAKAGIGEDVKSKMSVTWNQNEHEVGHIASQAHKQNEKGKVGHNCLSSTRPDAGDL